VLGEMVPDGLGYGIIKLICDGQGQVCDYKGSWTI
jgi:hypothetical protein